MRSRTLRRPHKYGAERTIVDGISFASKKEARRYKELKLLEMAGKIDSLSLQPAYPIKYGGKKICEVILDFAYVDQHGYHYEDVKGKDTPMSRLKRKLVEAFYGIKVEIIVKRGQR